MFRMPKKITSKDCYKLLLIFFWGKNFVCVYMRAIFLRLPIISRFADYIIPVVSLLCFIVAFPYIKKRITVADLLFVVAVAFAYCINLLIYPKTSNYLMANASTFWISVFPLFILGLRINPEEDVPLLYYVSLINIWLHFMYVLAFGEDFSQAQSLYSGAMGRAYNLLPQLLVISVFALQKPNICNVMTLLLGSMYLFSCGTRGAILCLFVFELIYFLSHISTRKRLGLYIAAALAMVFILLFYEVLLLWMRTIARDMGMSERIFNFMLSESFFESDSRIILAQKAMEAIIQRPIWGYGIAGDRATLGNYVHNLFWELLLSFGIAQGLIAFFYLIQLVVRAYIKSQNKMGKEFVLLLFCASIIKLFLSSSYLLEPLFFLTLGVCANQLRFEKRHYKISCPEMILYRR